MNFLGSLQLTALEGSALMKEESVFVDSRGVVTHATRYAFPCAQGAHFVTETGPCRRCEQEWWWSHGFVSAIDGWYNGALKIAHEEAPVLMAQGWKLQRKTASCTYLEPPETEGDFDLPMYEPEEIPLEVRRRFTLTVAPERPAGDRYVVTRLSRKGLMAYKRVAPTLATTQDHIGYLLQAR